MQIAQISFFFATRKNRASPKTLFWRYKLLVWITNLYSKFYLKNQKKCLKESHPLSISFDLISSCIISKESTEKFFEIACMVPSIVAVC